MLLHKLITTLPMKGARKMGIALKRKEPQAAALPEI